VKVRSKIALVAVAAMTATVSTAGVVGAQEGEGDVKIAAVLKTLANPYWVAMKDGIEARAAELGVEVTVQAATDESAIDEQTTILQTMSGQDFTCFLVAPITGTNLIQPLVDVTNAGLPIVNVDAPFDQEAVDAAGVQLVTYIASRNPVAGQVAAEEVITQIGGAGKVALIQGLPGDGSSIARIDGFKAAAGDLEIVAEEAADWDRETALNVADAIIQANPDVQAFYAANDGMALGVQQAVNNNELMGEVLVYGTDGVDDALQSIAAGQLAGTASQYPYAIGAMGVESCVALAQGATIPDFIESPIALITAANLEAAQAAAPAPFFEYDNPVGALLEE
jgi:ABC-type sugar transport system substrate-binding protein